MSSNEKSSTRIDLRKTGNVATIQFITEGGVTIFSSRVLGELGNAVEQLAHDPHVRFVVLRGSGKVFVAGADISEMSQFSEDQGRTFATHGHHVMNAIAALPQITFAAIHGHALGGGCELSLACDFRLAVKGIKIGLPESRLGLIPGWGGTMRLPRVVSLSQAKQLMFSGAPVSAGRALEIGLVDEVVDSPEDLDKALDRWFAILSDGSPAAATRIKRAILRNDEINQFATCFSCSDAKEGIAAFLAKRPPVWST